MSRDRAHLMNKLRRPADSTFERWRGDELHDLALHRTAGAGPGRPRRLLQRVIPTGPTCSQGHCLEPHSGQPGLDTLRRGTPT